MPAQEKSGHYIIKQILYLCLCIIGYIFLLYPNPYACAEPAKPDSTISSPLFSYKIINTYPHDSRAFTQGLIFEEGILYEGTGLYGRSSLKITELETGKTLKRYNIPRQFFGEGITIFGDRIIQLTWKSSRGFVYNKKNLEPVREFHYPTDGWGITHDKSHLIMSDGTDILRFLDPFSFKEINRIEVHENGRSVDKLNELEYIQGEIYANIFMTDDIVKIDPKTGSVTGRIELKGLLGKKDHHKTADVLNGIAYDSEKNRLFVTGKLWPSLFEIELIPAEDDNEQN